MAERTLDMRRGVIVFIRRDDGRWLMVRRAATIERAPLRIGFPGGEIDAGETEEQAAVREAREEIGVAIRLVERVWEHVTPNGIWLLCGYIAQIVAGEPTPNPAEVHEVLWLTAEEGASHPDALPACPEIFGILAAMD